MYKISTIHFRKRDKNHRFHKIKLDWSHLRSYKLKHNEKSHCCFCRQRVISCFLRIISHNKMMMNISNMTTLTAWTTSQLNHPLAFIAASDGTHDIFMCRVFRVTNIKELRQLPNHVFAVSKGNRVSFFPGTWFWLRKCRWPKSSWHIVWIFGKAEQQRESHFDQNESFRLLFTVSNSLEAGYTATFFLTGMDWKKRRSKNDLARMKE